VLFLACLLRGHAGNGAGARVAVAAAIGSVNAHVLEYFQSENLRRGLCQCFSRLIVLRTNVEFCHHILVSPALADIVQIVSPASHLLSNSQLQHTLFLPMREINGDSV